MSRNDNDHWAVANLLLGRYGQDAASEARQRATVAEVTGDRDAAEIWHSVEEALGDETTEKPVEPERRD